MSNRRRVDLLELRRLRDVLSTTRRSAYVYRRLGAQARSKQCMIGPAEINTKLPFGGMGRAASPPAGSGAEPREPNAFQQKYNENGFKLLTIGGEQACCRTVALLYTPKSDCVVSAV